MIKKQAFVAFGLTEGRINSKTLRKIIPNKIWELIIIMAEFQWDEKTTVMDFMLFASAVLLKIIFGKKAT